MKYLKYVLLALCLSYPAAAVADDCGNCTAVFERALTLSETVGCAVACATVPDAEIKTVCLMVCQQYSSKQCTLGDCALGGCKMIRKCP